MHRISGQIIRPPVGCIRPDNIHRKDWVSGRTETRTGAGAGAAFWRRGGSCGHLLNLNIKICLINLSILTCLNDQKNLYYI